MKSAKSLTVLFALLLAGATLAGSEFLTLRIMHQPAAALVDTLRPLVGRDGSVSAHGDRLIVRGTPAQLAEVKAVVTELDRPLRRLLIEVRQAGNVAMSTRGMGYGVSTGPVRLGEGAPGDGAYWQFQDIQTRGHDDSLHRVQAVEGRPALIRTGQSVPVYEIDQQLLGNRVVQGYRMQYQDTNSGFFALPRVHGDQVTVEIYQQHERPGPNGRFLRQHAQTVLQGGFGQWLTLGAVGDTDRGGDERFGRQMQTRRSGDRRIELRVLPVD